MFSFLILISKPKKFITVLFLPVRLTTTCAPSKCDSGVFLTFSLILTNLFIVNFIYPNPQNWFPTHLCRFLID